MSRTCPQAEKYDALARQHGWTIEQENEIPDNARDWCVGFAGRIYAKELPDGRIVGFTVSWGIPDPKTTGRKQRRWQVLHADESGTGKVVTMILADDANGLIGDRTWHWDAVSALDFWLAQPLDAIAERHDFGERVSVRDVIRQVIDQGRSRS